jgi:N-acyl-D-amino-acid deacylase
MLHARKAIIVILSLCTALTAAEPVNIPVNGPRVASMAPVDEAITTYMTEQHIDAATLTISRDGRILYTQGYGFLDAAHTRPAPADTPMRLASVSKPITAAVVRRLIADGKLTLDTRAFDYLHLALPEGADARLANITIEHLLNHRGGWDRAAVYDPMFHDATIRQRLDLDHPPTADDILRFMLTEPLQFDPGSRYAYSNFGYCLLGRIIERAAGESYIDCVKHRIAEPLNMPSLALARTAPALRNEREPDYPTGKMTLYTERMDAHGGMIATAPDLCRFLHVYQLDGKLITKRPGLDGTFFGSMPGATAMVRQRPDGLNLAVLLNRQFPDYATLKTTVDRAVDQITDRPN